MCSPSFSLKFRVDSSLHIEIKMQLNKLSKMKGLNNVFKCFFLCLGEKIMIRILPRNCPLLLLWSSPSSLWFVRLCVWAATLTAFCCLLYFGTGEIFQLCWMDRLESPAWRSGIAQGWVSLGLSWGTQHSSEWRPSPNKPVACYTWDILDLFWTDFRNGKEKWFQQEIIGFMTFPKLFPF